MMEKAAEALADWLIRCNVVEETDKELYSYAAYSFLLNISPLILAAVIGSCMGSAAQSIVLILPFMIIRKFSGGYHTKHLWTCLLCSSLLMILCITISRFAECDVKLFILAIGSGFSLITFSPLDNENRILEQNEKTYYKKITTMFVLMFIFIGILLHLLGLHTYTVCIFIGVMLAAGMQLPNIIKRETESIIKLGK